MISDKLYAYTAGLIDADGYISIIPRSGKVDGYERRGYDPTIKVAAVDKKTIDFLTKNFGGYVHKRRFIGENNKDAWQWELKNMDPVREFLENIISYMILKKPRAKLVIEYCKTKYSEVHPFSNDYNPAVVKRRDEIYKELRGLNHRGKDNPPAETK